MCPSSDERLTDLLERLIGLGGRTSGAVFDLDHDVRTIGHDGLAVDDRGLPAVTVIDIANLAEPGNDCRQQREQPVRRRMN